MFGLEADAFYARINGSIYDNAADADSPSRPNNSISTLIDWTGSVRGRVGYALGDLLIYGTGGLAFAHATVSATDGPLSDSAWVWGWTAGLGAERFVSSKISVKFEWLYTSLSNHIWFAGQPWQSTARSSSNAVRLGINLHF